MANHYEYCVMQDGVPGVHRGPWPREQCEEWIAECVADGFREGAFYLANRLVTDWEPVTVMRGDFVRMDGTHADSYETRAAWR